MTKSRVLVLIRDHLIKKGVESILNSVENIDHQAGGVIGFDLCRTLETPEDYELVLAQRHMEEAIRRNAGDAEDYWKYRWATLQVEYMYSVLLVGWAQLGLRNPPNLSTRAILKFNEVLTAEHTAWKKGERK